MALGLGPISSTPISALPSAASTTPFTFIQTDDGAIAARRAVHYGTEHPSRNGMVFAYAPLPAKTFYLVDSAHSGSSHGTLQEGGTPPSPASTATEWTGSLASVISLPKYSPQVYNAAQNNTTFGATVLPDGTGLATNDAWESQNKLYGTFVAGTWTVAIGAINSNAIAPLVDGNLNVRVWWSANLNGSGATQITSGVVALSGFTNLSTTQFNGIATFSAGAVPIAGYLFVQVAFALTGSASNLDHVIIRVDGANSYIQTPPFAPVFDPTAATFYPVFPHAISKPYLRPEEQLAFALYPGQVITVPPQWPTVFPERVIRPFFPVTEQQAFALYPRPEERIQLDWQPSYPDRALHPSLQVSEQLPFIGSPKPEFKIQVPSETFPHAVYRPNFSVTEQLAVTELPPQPEVKAPSDWQTCYPASVSRPFFSVTEQLAVTELSPNPLPNQCFFPIDVLGSRLYCEFTGESGTYSGGTLTDSIGGGKIGNDIAGDRPTLTTTPGGFAALHFDGTNDFLQAVFGANTGPIAPLALIPPAGTGQRLMFFIMRCTATPGTLRYVWISANETIFVSGAGSNNLAVDSNNGGYQSIGSDGDPTGFWRTVIIVVDETAPLTSMYIDGVAQAGTMAKRWGETGSPSEWDGFNPAIGASGGPSGVFNGELGRIGFAYTPTTFSGADISALHDALSHVIYGCATTPLSYTTYPDSVQRPAFAVSDQQFAANSLVYATVFDPATFLELEFPDRIDRSTFLADDQLAFVGSPQPEEKVQLDAPPVFPDRAVRSLFSVSEHQVFATSSTSERTAPLASTVHPDRVDRPAFSVVEQLAVSEIFPKPEETVQLDWGPDYPAATVGAFFSVSEQLASVLGPYPLPTVTAVDLAHYPDVISRPFFAPSEQLAVTETPPRPEEKIQLDWAPSFPSGVLRAVLPVSEYPAFAISGQPEERVQLDWAPQFPERIVRPSLLTGEHPAFVPSSAPEDRVDLDWAPVYPDRGLRLSLPVSDQLAVVGSPQPERTSALAVTVFPDRVERPSLHVSEQLASTEETPKPEDTRDLDWSPVYPSGVVRPTLLVGDQQALGFSPYPERTSALAASIYSDSVPRPSFGTSEQLAVTEISPRPERTSSLAVTVYPDRVERPAFSVTEQLAVTEISPRPEDRIALDWAPVFPERTLRATLPVSEHPFYVSIQQPEDRVELDWAPNYPERALRPALAAASQQAFVASPRSERTTAIASTVYPDRIDRPSLPTATQLAVTEISPYPEEKAQLDWQPVYPDRVVRPFLSVANQPYFVLWPYPITAAAVTQLNTGFGIFPDRVERPTFNTADQLDSTDETPFPERTSALASETHPDRVARPGLGAHEQVAVTELPPRPERTFPLAVAVFPDRVERPALGSWQQLAVSEIEPRPEERIDLDWAPSFPDRVVRPFLLVGDQAFYASTVQPEERVELDWAPSYPDRALRAVLPIAEFQAFATSARAERTSALASEVHPDRVERPFFAAHEQLAVTEETPKPERTSPLAAENHPDRVERPSFGVTEQLHAVGSPQPERASAIAVVVFPDRIERPALGTANQQFVTEIGPQPEDRIDLDWAPVYPDRAYRPFFAVAEQLASVLWPYPIPTAALTQLSTGFTIFPDTVNRPSLSTANHLAVSEETPKPERTSSLATTLFPDAVLRPSLSTAEQLASTEETPKPERTAPLAAVVHPDSVSRPSLHVSEQLASTELSPRPEDTRDLDWAPVYPERVPRPTLLAGDQQALALAPQPERTRALAAVVFPDTVSRPFLSATLQLAVTELQPQPEERSTFFGAVFPDRVVRPALPTSSQLAVTEISPRPIANITPVDLTRYPDSISRPLFAAAEQQAFVTSSAPERKSSLAAEVHPDRVLRPTFPVTEQLAVTELSPRPEHKIDLDWVPSFPDRALHLWLAIDLHQAFAMAPQPERAAPLAATVHPDRVDRPTLSVAEQQAFVTSSRPEHKIDLDWAPQFPGTVRRPFFEVVEQQAFVTSSKAERKDAIAVTVFPDRVERSYLLVDNHPAFVTSALPEEPLDWTPSFPDRIVRPTLFVGSHPVFVFWPFPLPTPPIPSETYPDRVVRPFLAVANQLAATELPPYPERESQIAVAVFPDRIDRPFLPAHEQLASIGNPRPVSGPVPFSISQSIRTSLRLQLTVGPFLEPPAPNADNGPILVPDPQGPAVLDGYEYILVLTQPPVGPTAQFIAPFATPYQIIEQQLPQRGVSADIRRFADGATVYRIPRRQLWKLKSDKIGPFVEQNAKVRYRLYPGDPTIGRTPLTIWLPVL